MSGALSSAWTLSFEISPIIFTGGIAQNIPGGALPIIAITEAASFVTGLLNGGGPPTLAGYFCHFIPLPGGTLAENAISEYPFANQSVAGNAIIAMPLTISALMICPVQDGGWAAKIATMAALTGAMAQHDSMGGTYTYVTPSMFYTDLIRTRMVDVSNAASKQPQNTYQIDFRKPLLTLSAAQSAQNTLMSKLSGGTQIQGQPAYSGDTAAVGQPSSLVGTDLPSGSSLTGMNTAPLIPVTSTPLPPVGLSYPPGTAANATSAGDQFVGP